MKSTYPTHALNAFYASLTPEEKTHYHLQSLTLHSAHCFWELVSVPSVLSQYMPPTRYILS